MSNVCIIRHAYYPQETHVRRNAEALADNGESVSLICLRGNGEKPFEIISGVAVYRMPVEHHRKGVIRYIFEYIAFFMCAFWQVTLLELRLGFRVVEVDTMPDFLVFCTLIPKLRGKRIVLYLFEAFPEEFANKYKLPSDHIVVKVMELIEQLAIAYSDKAITACDAFSKLFTQRGATDGKIDVILNVPNQKVFSPENTPVSSTAGKKPFTIITHGTLIELYGVQTVIEAVNLLIHQIPGIQLLIPGDGEYLPQLKQMTQKLALTERVSFVGWISQSEVFELIQSADVGIVPILGGYGELMVPNKLFEYISLSKPVVCSSLNGIRDYFNDQMLLFFPPGDANKLADQVLRLFHDPSLGISLASKAMIVYQEHQWDREKHLYFSALMP